MRTLQRRGAFGLRQGREHGSCVALMKTTLRNDERSRSADIPGTTRRHRGARSIVLAGFAVATLTGCDKLMGPPDGACTYGFEQSSPDGTVPQGLEVCLDKWKANACNEASVGAMSLGLKTSPPKFSEGKGCVALGYKACGPTGHAKVCPDELIDKSKTK